MARSKALFWIVLTVASLTLPEAAVGQRLYDAKRDEEAQAALKIAGALQSGTLFDKQLKNLSLLAKRDMEASLTDARASMRSSINSFSGWIDVNCVVRRVDKSISQVDKNDDITARLASIGEEIRLARIAFAELKRATECKTQAGSEDIDVKKCPELKPGKFEAFFEHAGDLEDIDAAVMLFDNSHGKNKDITEALDITKGVVAALKTLYENYKTRMDEYNHLEGELLDIQLQLKKVALQALQVEEQHLKNIIKIRARREREEAAILIMIGDYEAFSDQYGLGFDRSAPPPCNAEGSSSEVSIEMSLRGLVAKVKFAESKLDEAKQTLAELEFRKITPLEINLRKAQATADLAKPSAAKQDAESKVRQAEDQLRARTEAADIRDRRKSVDDLTTAVTTVRDELNDKLLALHIAAAISARGEIPRKLATLREANEQHAHSIRKSGVMARAYQLTVSGGVRRLALYHKGGIKPSKIAELIHAAATVAIPPVIASN
jgi:hypothetical protein